MFEELPSKCFITVLSAGMRGKIPTMSDDYCQVMSTADKDSTGMKAGCVSSS